MNKLHLAESALNRLMNFMDDLAAPPVADPAPLGAAIDAAIAEPTPAMPADPALADAVLLDSLGVGPR